MDTVRSDVGFAGLAEAHGGRPSPARQIKLRALVLAGMVGATTSVALVDPAAGGVYPACPSRTLLGFDCPGCGGLRGTHDLVHGNVVEALDHNLLLPVTLAVIAVALGMWLLPLVGRPARPLHPPQWTVVAAGVAVAAFTVLRNLPVPGLEWLGSSA
jgi:hypothetical protein